MNAKNIKPANRQAIFNLVYHKRNISKPEISSALHISVPTVSQYVNEFKTLGLVSDDTFLDSTGGRKAAKVSFLSNSHISIGVEILIDSVHLVALNLFGEVLFEESHRLPFSNTDEYCARLGNYVMNFFIRLNMPKEALLGVGFAIQGLVDKSGMSVIFGKIMNADGFSVKRIEKYVPFPCYLQHDSRASCNYMLWMNPNIRDAFYLILNDYFGGILVMDNQIHWGPYLPSGLIAHMTLVQGGKRCYCGKKGCVDAYCSARILRDEAQTDLDNFFRELRNGSRHNETLWRSYLERLTRIIYNLQIVSSIEIVIGGKLSLFMNEEDIAFIKAQELTDTNITSHFPEIHLFQNASAAAKGAALHYIKEFLEAISLTT